ncbi:hypothetical protein K8I85_10805, partial [bacterium]|nr:hypothetical protein [bacterium]
MQSRTGIGTTSRSSRWLVVAALAMLPAACESKPTMAGDAANDERVVDVDPTLFLAEALVGDVTTETATLTDGSTATCFVITTRPVAPDHPMGPWCPRHTSDAAAAGGIWLEGGDVHDVDGMFIENMANFYADSHWLMYDANGDIYVTDTEEDCAAAADPNVGPEYENHCVECLPSYIDAITMTYRIPVTPVPLPNPDRFGRGPGQSRGLALNGIVFEGPAPTDAILGAYTLAPFDDAGGHI